MDTGWGEARSKARSWGGSWWLATRPGLNAVFWSQDPSLSCLETALSVRAAPAYCRGDRQTRDSRGEPSGGERAGILDFSQTVSNVSKYRKMEFIASLIALCNLSSMKWNNNNTAGLFHFLFLFWLKLFSIKQNFSTEHLSLLGICFHRLISSSELPESKIQIHKVCTILWTSNIREKHSEALQPSEHMVPVYSQKWGDASWTEETETMNNNP